MLCSLPTTVVTAARAAQPAPESESALVGSPAAEPHFGQLAHWCKITLLGRVQVNSQRNHACVPAAVASYTEALPAGGLSDRIW
jgi:hypothetical protein